MIHKLCLFILVLGCLHSPSSLASRFSSKYDLQIRKATKLYLPVAYRLWGWEVWKAQLYQESRLDPDAVSPVGASGLAQFMPATWAEVSKSLDFNASPKVADLAILAGAFYMGRLRGVWTAKRTEYDRHSLAMASYNAGSGNLIKAQRACGGVNDYAGISSCLPKITGRHSQETLTYVRRIWAYWEQMKLGL